MRLVTLAQASIHCRRDSGDDDADFEMKVEAASEMVLEYIGAGADSWTDSAGQPFEDSAGEALDVPKRVKMGTLALVEHLYRNRAGAQTDNQVPAEFGYGYLPQGVIALLYPLRKPTVA